MMSSCVFFYVVLCQITETHDLQVTGTEIAKRLSRAQLQALGQNVAKVAGGGLSQLYSMRPLRINRKYCIFIAVSDLV